MKIIKNLRARHQLNKIQKQFQEMVRTNITFDPYWTTHARMDIYHARENANLFLKLTDNNLTAQQLTAVAESSQMMIRTMHNLAVEWQQLWTLVEEIRGPETGDIIPDAKLNEIRPLMKRMEQHEAQAQMLLQEHHSNVARGLVIIDSYLDAQKKAKDSARAR